MTSDRRASSGLSPQRRAALFALCLTALLAASAACQSQNVKDGGDTRGVIIVNAPATGEVRRVLVREGMSVNEGAPIIEIAVRVETQNTPPAPEAENPQARAGRNIVAAQAEVEAARAEVVRTEVEVQRLTPLVASNEAPQGQLDGARADYERAQQRFRRAQASVQDAQAGLVAARQPQSQNSSPAVTVTPSEQIVTARASSAGTISAINATVGARVTAGQPLATLRSDRR